MIGKTKVVEIFSWKFHKKRIEKVLSSCLCFFFLISNLVRKLEDSIVFILLYFKQKLIK